MTVADFLIGFLLASGFFVSAAISRMFRRTATGVLIGGVVGIGVSVAILYYRLGDVLQPSPLSAE